jgi:hypothetical protein
MIPSITPPTDNLYKFISLFGLTIFLFASYNLGMVYDQSAASKMRIEDLKVEVQKKLLSHNIKITGSMKTESDPKRFKPARIRLMDRELEKLATEIDGSRLDPISKIEMDGSLSKLNVKIDSLWLKEMICFGFAFVGFVVMLLGFSLWKRKEQNLRDMILSMEHAEKLKGSMDDKTASS